MTDKKRRVVRGPQDAIRENVPKQPELPSYSDIVAQSSTDVLGDLENDTNTQSKALDQYPKLKRSEDGKVIIEAAPVVPEKPSQFPEPAPQTH